MNLKNKTAIITGSTKGIGNGVAIELIKQGANVVVTSRDKEQAQKIANNLSDEYGGDAIGLAFNIENISDVDRLIDDVVDCYGGIDILVNNALSQNCVGPLDVFEDEQVANALNTNIVNTLLLTKKSYPYLKNARGNVISIGSIIVNKYIFNLPLYSIIKAAINQMTKSLAAEWAVDKIRVNAVNPGFTQTDAPYEHGMSEEFVKNSIEFYKNNYCPIGNIGQPEDIGALVSFLVSDHAKFITGSVYDIDGGFTVQGAPLYFE